MDVTSPSQHSPFLSARKFFKGLRAFFIRAFCLKCIFYIKLLRFVRCDLQALVFFLQPLIPILCVALNENIKEKEEHAIKRQVHLLPRQ